MTQVLLRYSIIFRKNSFFDLKKTFTKLFVRKPWCALLEAVKRSNAEMVKFLVLEMKANVNITYSVPYSSAGSPLTTAIEHCDESMIKLLIEELGADVNIRLKKTKSGPSYLPIHVAMYIEAIR